MVGCPSCQTELQIPQENFGSLYTCPKCQAVFFVTWDGQPEEHALEEQTPFEVAPAENSSDVENFSAVESFSAVENFSEVESFSSVETFTEVEPTTEPLQSMDMGFTDEKPLTPQQFVEEVIEFGNSTDSIEGLTYKLTIRGVDSADSREKLEDILREPRLGFDLQSLLQDLIDGHLEIQNLNTAKTYFLVQKLKQEAFDVTWIQNI